MVHAHFLLIWRTIFLFENINIIEGNSIIKDKKVKLAITSLLLVCVFLFLIISSSAVTIGNELSIQELSDIVNEASVDDVEYTIQTVKKLSSISNLLGYGYILCDLDPYGYVLMTDFGHIVECSYSEGANSPIPIESSIEYYYAGPGCFAIKNEGQLVNFLSGETVSQAQIQNMADYETRIREKYRSTSQGSTYGVSSSASVTNKILHESYFENLYDYGENVDGTCTVVAIAIMLGYYDYYVNSQYVPTGSTVRSSSGYSIGTTEAFHNLLCNYVYGYGGQRGGVYISTAAPKINAQYMNSIVDLSTTIAYTSMDVATTYDKVKELIDSNRIGVVSYTDYTLSLDGDKTHTAVVYGYFESASGNQLYIYRGWVKKSITENVVRLDADWFWQCGYIYDCIETGNHSYVWEYTSVNYHSGNSHFYQRKRSCSKCPSTNYYYEYEERACSGNCIEIMGIVYPDVEEK